MIKLIQGPKKEKMTIIKSISFDLDDTLWPLMPNIIKAEETTNKWIKENFPVLQRSLENKKQLKLEIN